MLDTAKEARLGRIRPGLLADPREIVRVAVVDRPGGHARQFVWVLPLGPVHDLRYPAAPCVQRHTAFGALVDLTAPAVDRSDRLLGLLAAVGHGREPGHDLVVVAEADPPPRAVNV